MTFEEAVTFEACAIELFSYATRHGFAFCFSPHVDVACMCVGEGAPVVASKPFRASKPFFVVEDMDRHHFVTIEEAVTFSRLGHD